MAIAIADAPYDASYDETSPSKENTPPTTVNRKRDQTRSSLRINFPFFLSFLLYCDHMQLRSQILLFPDFKKAFKLNSGHFERLVQFNHV